GTRGGALRDLVRVVGGRETGAAVEELADPALSHQMVDHPAEERPVLPHRLDEVGFGLHDLPADDAVDLEVVLPAQPVVVDAGGVRHIGADDVLGRPLRGGSVRGHDGSVRRTRSICGVFDLIAADSAGPTAPEPPRGSAGPPRVRARKARPCGSAAGSGVRTAQLLAYSCAPPPKSSATHGSSPT